MNICVDGRLLDLYKNTGISRYTQFIIEYYRSRNHKIILILNDKSNVIQGCTPVLTELKPYNILHFYKFANFIDQIPADIIHIPFYSGINKPLKDKKIIITVHDLMFLLVDNFFGTNRILNLIKRKYFDIIVRNSIKTSNAVISVSQTTKNDIFNYYKHDSVVIPENSELTQAEDNTILNKLKLKPKGYYFYCGNNRFHKNITFISKIFNTGIIKYPLVLSGTFHEPSCNVITTGLVNDEELKCLYKNAIAFIFPSLYEGFGLPILESLYCSTPVIASSIPAFREFKCDNITFFDPYDPDSFLEAIVTNKKHNFVECSKFFDNYSINHIYTRLDNLIENLK